MAKRTLYWDSSIFLCFLNRDEEVRRNVCEDILQHASMDEIGILTSTYTIVEVIRPKRKSLPRAAALKSEEIRKIKDMFRWPFIATIELDDRTAHLAADLARDHGLLPADSVHAPSAILWKADVLQAWDRDFSAISHKISIEEPQFISQQTSFEGMKRSRIGPTPDDFETK
jgi:predicted nucleic acid-binding protein